MVDEPQQDGGLRVVLASTSPRRRGLLAKLGVGFDAVAVDVDETELIAGREPVDAVSVAAQAKLEAALSAGVALDREPHDRVLVIAADTLVVTPQGTVEGKPVDRADAFRMIRACADDALTVVTGVAMWSLVDRVAQHTTDVASTTVRLRPISEAEIEAYLDTDVPWDKAGALELQGASAPFVAGVEGCWTNVVGLPLCLVAQRLRNISADLGPPAECKSVCAADRKIDANRSATGL